MVISQIGAKVKKMSVGVIQSQRLGKFFFLHCWVYFERKNLISSYSFTSVLSVHSAKYGHNIRYTDQTLKPLLYTIVK